MRKLTLPIVLLALVLTSCQENLTNLNEDPKAPADVPGETLFSNAQVSLGTYLNNTDINENIFKLMSQYWASTTYATESQYELTTRAIPSNLWSELYRDVLKDLEESRKLIANNSTIAADVKQNQLAAIEVLKVLTYSELVNIFGNIPYSEALDPETTHPSYDDAETIHMDLMSRLNTAIDNFDPNAEGFGTADVFYGSRANPIEAWIKFANSLKMRLGITIADVNTSAAQTAIETASPNAFTSNEDNAIIPFQSTPPHTNPLWEALVQSGRHDYVPANTLVDTMNALEDPRRPIFFTQLEGEYVGGIYGSTNEYEDFSHFGERIKQENFEGMILEYAEVEFIRAEAAARGWDTGVGSGLAADHYENAIRADMEYWGVPESEIDDYVTDPDIAYDTAPGSFREKIGTQKWLGLYLQGLQGWTEWRRLDYPILNVPPQPEGLTYDDIPKRFTYPVDEQNLNQSNYEAASSAIGGDELTNRLFWDVPIN